LLEKTNGTKEPVQNRFVQDVLIHTLFLKMLIFLTVLWLFFSAGLYLSERSIASATITSYGNAFYWGIAALSTTGIVDIPISGLSQLIGGRWIVLGSSIFFGTIVATIAALRQTNC
jgi:voltage-gated potassium channel